MLRSPVIMEVLWTHSLLTFDGNNEFDHDSTPLNLEDIRLLSRALGRFEIRDSQQIPFIRRNLSGSCQGDPASVPPSTDIDAPITKEAESDNSHATASPTSEGRPKRPAGFRVRKDSR